MIITRPPSATVTEDVVEVVEPAPPTPVYATTLEWVGPDGRTWNLTDPASPVFKMEGWKGLEGSAYDHWFSTAPTLDGSTWEGMRTERGDISGPVFVSGADLETFLAEHAAFLRSLDPKREGYLRLTRPDGTYRQIACRSDAPPVRASDRDILADLFVTYGLSFSTDPYWQGPPVEVLYEYDPGLPFFPGPPFNIGKGFSIANATVTNPGDVESFPVWRVTGPFTAFSVGVGDASTSVESARVAGQWVEVDTRPGVKTIRDETGADVASLATSFDMSGTIPADAVTPLALSVTDPGVGTSVRLSFTPRYWSAW